MRVSLNPRAKFCLQSALLLIVFLSVGGCTAYYLYLADSKLWLGITTFLGLGGSAGAGLLLISAIFRAKATSKGVCFRANSFMAEFVVDYNDEFCPVVCKTIAISTGTLGAVIAAVFLIGATWVVVHNVHIQFGISYWCFVIPSLLFFGSLILFRNHRAMDKISSMLEGLAVISIVVLIASLLMLGFTTFGWSMFFHIAVALSIAGVATIIGFLAFRWEKVRDTNLGRLLTPLKRLSCIPTSVCRDE